MALFPEWAYPTAYKTGQYRTFKGKLYRCLQDHTSQASWEPSYTTSLWVKASDPSEEWPAWSQPLGAHDSYAKGAKVTHNLIEAAAARERKKDKKEREKLSEQQKGQEKLLLCLIEGTWAAVALAEATARAVQRIPDAHCNGDMHAALDYAAGVKHKQKEFLAKQGVHAILDT